MGKKQQAPKVVRRYEFDAPGLRGVRIKDGGMPVKPPQPRFSVLIGGMVIGNEHTLKDAVEFVRAVVTGRINVSVCGELEELAKLLVVRAKLREVGLTAFEEEGRI